MKTCTKCKTEKSFDDFWKSKGYKGGYRAECKSCESERLKKWRKENPEKHRLQWLRSYDTNRDLIRENNKLEYQRNRIKNNDLRKNYGITIDTFREMEKKQGYLCACCGRDDVRLVVDHCHETGQVRHLLCNRCNVAIAFLEEDPVIAERIGEYMKIMNDR